MFGWRKDKIACKDKCDSAYELTNINIEIHKTSSLFGNMIAYFGKTKKKENQMKNRKKEYCKNALRKRILALGKK